MEKGQSVGAKTSLYAVVTEEEKFSHIPHLLVRLAPNLGEMSAHLSSLHRKLFKR